MAEDLSSTEKRLSAWDIAVVVAYFCMVIGTSIYVNPHIFFFLSNLRHFRTIKLVAFLDHDESQEKHS